MAGVLGSMVQGVTDDVGMELSQQLWKHFADLFFTPLPVFADPTVRQLQQVAMAIALGALPAVIAYQALRRMVDSMTGESTIPAETLVRRCFIAGITVTGITLFAWFAGTLAEHMKEVLESLQPTGNPLRLMFRVGEGGGHLAASVLFLVFLAAAGAVVVQRAILGAEFSILLIIGAFLGLSRASDENALPWLTWKRELTAILVTPLLQLLILYLFAERLVGMTPEDQKTWLGSLERWLESGALIYLLWNTPRWARQFTYSTGVAHGAVGAAAGAGRFAVMQLMVRSTLKGA